MNEPSLPMTTDAFFDTKPYDRAYFERAAGADSLRWQFHEFRLSTETAATASGSLAVTHVSTHVALATAIERVRHQRVLDVIHLTNDVLSRFLERPRIAVCGLNPHAGEHGLFGTEDIEHIAPAIAAAMLEGIDATGPHPADTVFFQAVHRNRYDAIVCMYHDQGHGPMKLLAFDTGVNVTLGLPIVRTSVDHGTAFDIAWKGEAFTDSVGHALDYARKLVRRS